MCLPLTEAQTQAISGFNTLIRWNGALVGEVKDITPPTLTRISLDATHQQSPGAWMEAIKGIKDPSTWSFDINFVPGSVSHDAILSDLNDNCNNGTIRVTFPNGVFWESDGFLLTFAPSAPVNGILTASLTFQASGPPRGSIFV